MIQPSRVCAEDDPALEGLEVGSSLAVFMDVHVGSPLVRSEEAVVTSPGLPSIPTGPATLEVGGSSTHDPMHAAGTEIPWASHLAWITTLVWCSTLLMILLLSVLCRLIISRCLQPWDFLCSFPTFR
jgi:hypothetical protein